MKKEVSVDKPFTKALIPIDGSRYSMQTAEYGIKLAKAYGMEILAFYVIDETSVESLTHLSKEEPHMLQQNLRREGENCLNYLAELAADEGVKLETRIRTGTPHQAIVETARAENVDLIIIGKVGQRGPRRILIGSVTERVIESARCPVLVVRQR